MTAIAGIASPKKTQLIECMLEKMKHRGRAWMEIHDSESTTFGIAGTKNQENARDGFRNTALVKDGCVPARFAQAQGNPHGFILKRDPIGAAPLYYGWTETGEFCFASEVKALLLATTDIHELPPGYQYDGNTFEPYYSLKTRTPVSENAEQIITNLRKKLEQAVEKSVAHGCNGSWLSGGLDSSVIAAIARPRLKKLYTFAAGLPGAPDLDNARIMAEHIKSEHYEIVVQLDEILGILPEVIYYLESFDALLVRSSILNFLVARFASTYVQDVFSGEGGDELFAGYEYLKDIPLENLPDELVDIIGRLHNTALQRVDRSASAHSTVPHVCFLDPDVVDYALQIPAEYKLHQGVEKWILRQAVADLLPFDILNRRKAKFWEGGGFLDLLTEYAEQHISDEDFTRERDLDDGSKINSKEELYYYRIFIGYFRKAQGLGWMGRTKGVVAN
jgi:asparagine synthase (glutamine-hydrolysing)